MNFFPLLFLFAAAIFGNEGLFSHKSWEERFSVITHFLPPDPAILLIGASEELEIPWPLAFLYHRPETRKIDLLWVEQNDPSLLAYFSQHAQAIYAHSYLGEIDGYTILSKWIGKENQTALFYVRNEVYEGFVNSVHFTPPDPPVPLPAFHPPVLSSHLRSVNGSPSSSLPGIDAIYLINLDQRPEKWLASRTQLEKYGIVPTRFQAVNGWDLSLAALNDLGVKLIDPQPFSQLMGKTYKEVDGVEYKRIEFIADPEYAYFHVGITRGAIGCLLSHLSVLTHAFRSGYETIWVLEDDIQVLEDPQNLSSLIVELDLLDPEWDILYTDPNSKDPQGNPVPCTALALRPDLTLPPLVTFLEKSVQVSERLSRIGMRYGTYSMILRRSGIQKILDFYQKHRFFLPYDCDLWLIPSIRLYCANREIVTIAAQSKTDNAAPNYHKGSWPLVVPSRSEEEVLPEVLKPHGPKSQIESLDGPSLHSNL